MTDAFTYGTGKRRLVLVVLAVALLIMAVWVLVGSFGTRSDTASRNAHPTEDDLEVRTQPLDHSPATVRSESERSDGAVYSESGIEQTTGTVQFLGFPSRTLPMPSTWRFARIVAGRQELLDKSSDSLGLIRIPVGSWTLMSLNPSLSADPSIVTIESTNRATVWVRTKGRVVFRVADLLDRPIHAATVSWAPTTDGSCVSSLCIGRTDEAGIVVLDGCLIDAGSALVAAQGFAYTRIPVVQPDDRIIHIQLHPTLETPWLLTFVDTADGSPSSDPQVTTADGHVVSHPMGGRGTVTLIDRRVRGVLIVRSSNSVPASFRLEGLTSTTVPLPGITHTRIEFDPDFAPADDVVDLHTQLRSTRDDTPVHPVFDDCLRIDPKQGTEIILPRGYTIALQALSRNGAYDEQVITTSETAMAVLFYSKNAHNSRTVVVSDSAGTPLSRAWALLDAGNQTELVASDGNGRLEVPVVESRTITIGAPGYARQCIECVDSHSATSTPYTVTLERASQLCLRFVDKVGHSVPGVAVHAWQANATTGQTTSGLSFASCACSDRVATTDTDGRVAFDGLHMAPTDISFRMDPLFATDEFGQSLFQGTRSLTPTPEATEQLVTIDPPFSLGLAVYEASSGLPVANFQVATCDRTISQDVDGYSWRGIVSRSASPLSINVPSVGTASVDVSSDQQGKVVDVFVRADSQTELSVEGLEAGLANNTFNVVVYQQTTQDTRQVARIPARLNNSRCQLVLPMEGDVFVALEGSAGGPSFEPRLQPWKRGGTVTFVVRADARPR